ncbi:hypothetical protein AMTR_s00088p00152640 [Amborella trichopoda]|uniref:Disease resistance N-terminal domain-containing protein n=1 Tax=Amborella trichopoda TaxID=13333 RepID=W1NWE9_AMBTC|nr:hypothetical protein AMTR_s00088p00152640 [Amborella trichopoda]
MANPAVSFLLQKLDKLLVDEVQLLSGVKDGIQWIKDELEGMKVLLKNADEKRERNEAVDAWVRQVRDIAYDAEDVPDKFIIEIARLQRRRGWLSDVIRFFYQGA